MAGDDQGRISDNYAGNFDRLVSIKKTYDPTNVFRMNQNISPSD
jgi:FAD/FMN-containing dehydrogenase